MMTFFDNASHTASYPVADIRIIHKRETNDDGVEYHRVSLTNGAQVIISDDERRQITMPIVQRLSAEPGHAVLHLTPGNGVNEPDRIIRSPLIAWGFTAEGDVIPITIEGENDGMYRPMPVVMPDGRVRSPEHDAIFDSVEAFARLLRRDRDEAAAEKAKRR